MPTIPKEPHRNKPVSPKTIALVVGAFFCLLPMVLILDVGYFCRAIGFPFVFLFGFSSYIIYFVMLLIGIILIFKDHPRRPGPSFALFGFIVMAIGTIPLFTIGLYAYGDEGAAMLTLNDFNARYLAHFDSYFANVKSMFLYSGTNPEIGGGWLGYLVVGALNTLFGNQGATLAFSVSVTAIGALLVILPPVIKRLHARFKKARSLKAETMKKPAPAGAIAASSPVSLRDRSKETIRVASSYSAPSVPPKEDVVPPLPEAAVLSPATAEAPASQGTLAFQDDGYLRVGGLVKARYHRGGEIFDGGTTSAPASARPAVSPSPILANSIPAPKAEEPGKKPEQMSLDFDAAPEPLPVPDPNPEFLTPTPVAPSPIMGPTTPSEAPAPSVENVHPPRKFIEPDTTLLFKYEVKDAIQKNTEVAEIRKAAINETLSNYRIGAQCSGYVIGPAVTRYNISYSHNVSVRSVSNCITDISIHLGGIMARFEPIVAGEPYSGLEIANAAITTVGFREVFENLPDRTKHPLAIGFGKDISGNVVYADFNKFPHMLVAGATGSGKSIFVHSVLMTLIMRNSPDDLQMVLVDPKKVELALYRDMPHLLCPIISESDKANVCMLKLVDEMERRYSTLQRTEFTDISQYNEYCETHPEEHKMPYILVVVDEYADLVDSCKEIAYPIVRIAQKARAAGIHLLISTQRPSTNVITGTIKGNLPTHVAFRTSNAVDSVTILGEGGAETLLGKGDSLLQSPEVSRVGLVRAQAPFVQNSEIKAIVGFLKSSMPTYYDPEYLDLTDHSADGDTRTSRGSSMPSVDEGGTVDERYEDVKSAVMAEDYYSISKMQREFGFGFTRAGKIFVRLKNDGIIADKPDTPGSAKGCKVLVHDDGYDDDPDIGSSEVTSFDRGGGY